MTNQLVPLNTIQIKSLDELVNLFKQGYRIDTATGSIKHQDGNTILTMLDGTTITITGLVISVAAIMVAALLYYKLGKWEAKKLGWN